MDVRWDSVAQKQAERLEEYLGCPCTWIPSMTEDRPILEAYREARKRGGAGGLLASADLHVEQPVLSGFRRPQTAEP